MFAAGASLAFNALILAAAMSGLISGLSRGLLGGWLACLRLRGCLRGVVRRCLRRRLVSLRLAFRLALSPVGIYLGLQLLHILIAQHRFVPEGPIGDKEDIVMLGYRNCYVGGHSREQFLIGIGKVYDRCVDDHILGVLGIKPYLGNLAPKRLSRKGVDTEVRVHAFAYLAHVGLVYGGKDLHLPQVIGDREQRRCLKTGGDGLANVNVSRNYHAVYRRPDYRVSEVHLSHRQLRFSLLNLPFGLLKFSR